VATLAVFYGDTDEAETGIKTVGGQINGAFQAQKGATLLFRFGDDGMHQRLANPLLTEGRMDSDFVDGGVTVFAATKVNEANNRAGVQACKRAHIFGNCDEQSAFLDGFFQCGKFDETQLMPMLVCQRFHLSDIASPCKANHHCHCPSPVKILAHPKIAAVVADRL
jgi:hypothetical protein